MAAMLNIRVDDDVRSGLEDLARSRGLDLSSLVREQLDVLLGRDTTHRMDREDVPFSLSMERRVMLASQHDVLALLDPEEADYHRRVAEVLRKGFSGEYDIVFGGLYPELARGECTLLWDLLDMFQVVDWSIARLGSGEREELGDDMTIQWMGFNGFDMQDSLESRLLSYARHLASTGRWEWLTDRFKVIGDRGNSHSRRLPLYRRLLAEYTPRFQQKEIGEPLNLDDLKAIRDARAYRGE